MGEDRPPQFTATKEKIALKPSQNSFQGLLRTISNIRDFTVPSQKLSFPLQFPVDRHCLIFDPRRIKPSSHINFSLCGYVVILPSKDPLLGVVRAPQSFAVEKMWMESRKDYDFTMANLY